MTNVEIKTGVYYYEDIEEKTLEIIKKYHLEDRVMFSSFNHLSLERLKELAPDIPRGALLGITAAAAAMPVTTRGSGDSRRRPSETAGTMESV